MSKPMTSSQLIGQLKKWKIPYTAFKTNWATHNRGQRGNGFSNINGVINHHTGTSSQTIQNYLYSGSGNLPGPLCHVANDIKGRIWLIGWGRTNHAGWGSEDVLNKVIAENYKGILKPGSDSIDGNGRFYGIEHMYSGSVPMSAAQYETAIRFNCAILDFHGWKAESSIAHGEWTRRKWDPGISKNKMMDMSKFRTDVRNLLKEGPSGSLKGSQPKEVEKPPVQVKPPEKGSQPLPGASHTVQRGETLWGLAEKYLGDGKRWIEIISANQHLINLNPGVKITLPKK